MYFHHRHYLNHANVADPRVTDWPLMSSPIPTFVMVVVYLYVVMFLGPRVMANRKPFKLNNILVVYNAAQVVFSLVMLWEVRSTITHFRQFCYICLLFLYRVRQCV